MRQHFHDPKVFFLPLSPFSDVQNILQCVEPSLPVDTFVVEVCLPPNPSQSALVTLWGSTWGASHNSYPKTGKNRFKKVWFYLLGSCSQKLYTICHKLKHEPEKLPLTKATNAHPHWWGAIWYPVWRQSGPAFVLRTPSWEDCANRRGEVKLEKRNN